MGLSLSSFLCLSPAWVLALSLKINELKKKKKKKDKLEHTDCHWGTWVAQSVKLLLLISAQGMILWFWSLNPVLGSLLSVQSPLEMLSPLSLCPCPAHAFSHKNKQTFKKQINTDFQNKSKTLLICILSTRNSLYKNTESKWIKKYIL